MNTKRDIMNTIYNTESRQKIKEGVTIDINRAQQLYQKYIKAMKILENR